MEVKRGESIGVRILAALAEREFRITRARKEVVAVLIQAHNPHTIREIAQRVSVDEGSVYRTIALLVKLAIVEEIEGKSEAKRYALSPGEHHHHIVCTECGHTAHVPCNTGKNERVRHPEFRDVTSHSVTYYGRCKICA